MLHNIFSPKEWVAIFIIWLILLYAAGCNVTHSFEPWLYVTPDNLLPVIWLAVMAFFLVGLAVMIFDSL